MKYTPYKWLDVGALCRRLLPATDTINRIRYFTAIVKSDPSDPQKDQRQKLYIRALRTIPSISIHEGHFLKTNVRMPLVNKPATGPRTVEVIKTEEKGSDVNLASWLLLDAHNQDFEQAIIASNDSDLATPLWMVKHHFSGVAGVWNPHSQATCDRAFKAHPGTRTKPRKATPSFELKKVAKFQIVITSDGPSSDVALCQFPDTMSDTQGTLSKPSDWN